MIIKQIPKFPSASLRAGKFQITNFCRGIFICLLFSGITNLSAETTDLAGVVTNVIGNASLRTAGNSEWTPVTKGAFIYEGTDIKTASNGKLAVTFTTGAELKLNANTQMTIGISDPSFVGQGHIIRLHIGELWIGLVRQLKKFGIMTIAGMVEIEVAELNIRIDETGKTYCSVYSGNVVVKNAQGESTIPKNKKLEISPGEPPGTAEEIVTANHWEKELLPPGKLCFELKDSKLITGMVYTGKIVVRNNQDNIMTNYFGEVNIDADSDKLKFSVDKGITWHKQVRINLTAGESEILFKSLNDGTIKISLWSVGTNPISQELEFIVARAKNLHLKIRTSSGDEKELVLEYKLKR